MTWTNKLLLLALCLLSVAYVITFVIPHIMLLIMTLLVGGVVFFGIMRLILIAHSVKKFFV